MLDKRTARFLSIIAKICEDGSYKIVEKTFLTSELKGRTDFAMLDQMVRYLQDNEMIDVKYSDEKVHCLSVLPKGRVFHESSRAAPKKSLFSRFAWVILIVACSLAAFLGAFVASLVT